ncbi:hypothetical protein LUZ62_047237 [Rhynchospora pubera]|uniref:DUF4283 domain-containing protein n=1 Tax=Rhynchospora pubera TaxID=906938 RepID=A0AAV8FY03_9POAL|nr:hypothetical protein LUZ62_047237 [Rhynchospora pubera]
MSSRVVFEGIFSSGLRKINPQTKIQGLGNNCFTVEFTKQEELLRVMAKNIWLCNKDLVVMRMATGADDLTDPHINDFECWVEVHGVPPESLDQTGIEMVMQKIGAPLTEIKSFWYGGQRVYKRKVLLNLKESLQPKLPMRHPQLGVKWIYVVYDNIANVCMFCAMIGHDQSCCPRKFRLKQMQHEEEHKEKLGSNLIPETMEWKWLTNRALVPREDEHDTHRNVEPKHAAADIEKAASSSAPRSIEERGLKRPIDLNQYKLLTVSQVDDEAGDDSASGHLNYKRAKEAIPNSHSRFQ